MRILVLYGGSSDEREVSLRSGKNVAEALQKAGYEPILYDPDEAAMSLRQAVQGCDVVFSALHGAGGEDGTTQALLERLDVPYVGSDVYASELCFDKWNYRTLLATHGVILPRGELVDEALFWKSELIQQPFIIKPPKGGSSIDTILVHDPGQFDKAAIEADFRKHRQLILEELIIGTELTVGVLGQEALPVIEIIPPAGADFDYANKYNGKTQELCPPVHVSVEVQQMAQTIALQAHVLTGCRDFSRSDIMCDRANNLFLLETNTIPGLTEQSLLPKAAAAANTPMPQLCDQLIQMALKRRTASA